MDRRTVFDAPLYVVDIENDDWRVVIPIYGKLSPVPHKTKLGSRVEADACRAGADGLSTVSHLQADQRLRSQE